MTLKFFNIKSLKLINKKQNINKKENFFWNQIIIKIIKFELKLIKTHLISELK